jgi:hypothetical protein
MDIFLFVVAGVAIVFAAAYWLANSYLKSM